MTMQALPIGTTDIDAFAWNVSLLDKVMNGTGSLTRRDGSQCLALADLFQRVGLEPPVALVAGLQMARTTQTVAINGMVFRPNPASLPFTTPAGFQSAQWLLVSNISREELASVTAASGASLIGIRDAAGRFAGVTVETALAEVGAALAGLSSGADSQQSVIEAMGSDLAAVVAAVPPIAARVTALEVAQSSGAFTPTLAGFATSGTVTVSGRWSRSGKAVSFSIAIVPSAGGAFSSAFGSSFINGLPFTPAIQGAVTAVFDNGGTAGNALLMMTGQIKAPTFPAQTTAAVFSGVALLA